ncbi:ATP12 family protein [Citromicrobium bathyomarinum]|uniref:ATP12 family protein n=1 Tax=Citromicrobium bathyomarinum TaxID=72174 RepID=UPI00315A5A94
MKRFWKAADLTQVDCGWQVALDGRPVKTRCGSAQILPTRALGELLRGEWADAPEEVHPDHFPLRDLADRAIDSVANDREPVIARLLGFADGDTLCYRAEPDEAVARRQAQVWDPIVAQVEDELGITLSRTHSILHKPQAEPSRAAIRQRLESESAFVLAALDASASLAASLCVALAGLKDDADAQALWAAANLEEDFQAEQWGVDAEALARRNAREAEFARALAFARAARSPD